MWGYAKVLWSNKRIRDVLRFCGVTLKDRGAMVLCSNIKRIGDELRFCGVTLKG